MTIKKIIFNVLYILVLSLLSVQAVAGHGGEFHVSLDLQNVTTDKDRVTVTILTPAVQARVVNYVLPDYLPSISGKVNALRFVHRFYALDDRGYPLKVKKKGKNTVQMKLRSGATLRKIEYYVDDTWDDTLADKNKNVFIIQSVGTNFEAGKNFLLNHAFIYGYIEGFSKIPYRLTIRHPAGLQPQTAMLPVVTTAMKSEFTANSYDEMLSNPVMVCAADTIGFMAGNTYIQLAVYSESGAITARHVRRLVAAEINAVTRFMSLGDLPVYKMIFYFASADSPLKRFGNYRGNASRSGAIYFFSELQDEDAFMEILQQETFGDMLRAWAPLDCYKSCATGNYLQPQVSSAWWFSEGTKSYFSWLADIRDSLVNQSEFMDVVSAKIRLSQKASAVVLSDRRKVSGYLEQPIIREQVRAKATIACLLLDIEMTERSGGKNGLREFVAYLNDSLETYYPDSLMRYITRFAGTEVANLAKDLVVNNRSFPLIKMLSKIGWAYSPSGLNTVLTFGRTGVYYDNKADAFFVNMVDTNNVLGLKRGDRLIAVNNVLVAADNFDQALFPLYHPQKGVELKVQYIRNNVNAEATGEPMIRDILVDHYITDDPACSEDALLLNNRIFNPYW
jgi:predicted metalloprotease with PDZ domain